VVLVKTYVDDLNHSTIMSLNITLALRNECV